MPPKRSASTRKSAGKSKQQDVAPPESEDTKPNIEAETSGPELPSDPLATEPTQPTPQSASAASPPTAPSVSQQTGTSAASPAPAGKRPPRAPRGVGRRSQASRDAQQKAEEDKKKAEEEKRKATAVASESRGPSRAGQSQQQQRTREGGYRGRGSNDGRGRGRGRGRGGYMSASDRDKQQAFASGPFSAGQVTRESRQRKRPATSRRRTGGGGGGGSRTGVGSGSGEEPVERTRTRTTARADTASRTISTAVTAEDGSTVKQEAGAPTEAGPAVDRDGDLSMDAQPTTTIQDGGYISSDEEQDEKGLERINVEDLGIIDLTQDDEYDPYAPVRVHRIAHKDRSLGINADGATNQEGTVTVDANDITAVQPGTTATEKRKGKQKAKDVEITGENTKFQATYSDSDSEREPDIKPDPEDPAQNRDATPEPVERQPTSGTLPQEPSSSPESKRKGKEKVKAVSFSNEITAERPDYQTQEELEEWERRQRDLLLVREELGLPTSAVDINGDATMTDASPTTEDRRADKVYLFQFPPILPPLQSGTTDDGDVTMNGTHAEVSDALQTATPVIKPDPDANPAQASTSENSQSFPTGALGKLKVHASGRVTLDWGGTSFCMGMGTETSFLQDIVLAKLPDRKPDDDLMDDGGGPGGGGVVTSLGQVKGKFVVTPDWEEMLR